MDLSIIGSIILGLGVLILIGAFFIGSDLFSDSIKIPSELYLGALSGVICIFAGILIDICESPRGFILFAVSIILLIFSIIRFKLQLKKEEEENARKEKIECVKNIYMKCVEKDILDLNSEKNLATLKLVAKNFGVDNLTEAKQYYKAGEIIVKREELAKEKSLINKTRNDEIKVWEEQKKIAAIKGKEKYIGNCTDPNETYESLIRLRDAEKRLLEINANRHAKTHNSAIVGGAVSALAGTGAGVAAAMSNEAKNAKAEAARAERRANLEQSKKNMDKLYARSISEARKSKDNIEYILDKLCDEDNVQEKFKLLEFSDYSFELLKTGNVMVNVEIKEKEEITILDNPGILDGSLLFEVYNKAGNVAATGYYNAPGYQNKNLAEVGFGKISEISLICRSYYNNAAKISSTEGFTLKIKPVNMWIIEK